MGRVAAWRRRKHRRDDILITRAAAEVSLQGVPDLLGTGIAVAPQEVTRRHHHSGGAVATLERMVLVKRLLERVQLSFSYESLCGSHLPLVRLDRKDQTALDTRTVEIDGA
ncbi:hypothetical protein GCM10027521_54560 [Amycolatopsis cihanbeyliensis]